LEEFGACGLAWGRIVEEIIVEELWKHLVNAAFLSDKKIAHKIASTYDLHENRT
jgi:hypothetical protein